MAKAKTNKNNDGDTKEIKEPEGNDMTDDEWSKVRKWALGDDKVRTIYTLTEYITVVFCLVNTSSINNKTNNDMGGK